MSRIGTTIFFLMFMLIFSIGKAAAEQWPSNHAVLNQTLKNAPVPIFYGLNESHSNSWAQTAGNGITGVVYFQYGEENWGWGNLVYQSILSDGTVNNEVVTVGTHLEISVLLYDADSNPHIFTASSTNTDQLIDHYYRYMENQWTNETILHFNNEGGKFIYELSADRGPNDSFHLLALKTRSNPDSDDYYYAFRNSQLYHISNSSGDWVKELINQYDMVYTLDEYSKMMNRQDIKIDKNGDVHVIYGEQINALTNFSPSRLQYATNQSGHWVVETALNYVANSRDDAGWYSSLCLDSENQPHVSCCYIGRVSSGSAMYAKLIYLSRLGVNNWQSEVIAENDDGYYGRDGRDYTGGLTHLVFDDNNTPHVIFSDIASSHAGMNYFNLGNIRYAVKESGVWNIRKIYQQPVPIGNYNATEMYDMCLLISDNSNKIQVIGQELEILSNSNYECRLAQYLITDATYLDAGEFLKQSDLLYNYPNPFNRSTMIKFSLAEPGEVQLNIYNLAGQMICSLAKGYLPVGEYDAIWNGLNSRGEPVGSGIYIYHLISGEFCLSKRMLFLY